MPVALAALVSAAFSIAFIARASFQLDGHRYFTLFDDAMVSMRYGRMFAEGHGLVWNAGEPPVEGYTNLLWTLWMAMVHAVGLPDRLTSLAVSISGLLILTATVYATARLARRLAGGDGDRAAPVAAFAVGLCYPLAFWTLRGMEVGLLALLIVVAVDLALDADRADRFRPGRLAIVLALLTLTRPDGVLPAAMIALSTAVAARTSAPRRSLALVGLTPFVVLAAHTLFRLAYYGVPLPNTYYLKMTGVAAGVRLARGVETLKASSRYLAVPLLFALANRRVYRDPNRALAVAIPLALVAYTVYVGGDAWEWMPYTDRYLTPGLPLLFAAAAGTVATVSDAVGRRWSNPLQTAAVALLAWTVSGPGVTDWVRTRGSHVVDDANMVWMGVRVGQTTAPATRIGVVWAGAVPYFSRRPTVDFLGKSDPVIARHAPVTDFYPGHDRFDYEYSIGTLKPDLVVQLWFPPPNLFDRLAAWDYEQVFGGVFARRGAAVDVKRLRAAFDEPAIK